eukprot:gene6190-2807_t
MSPVTAAHPKIELIASDVDGTLLTHTQTLTTRVERAIKLADAAGVKTIVATGKARGPWVKEIFPRLNMSMPGGLLICDAVGKTLYEKTIDHDVVQDVIDIATEAGVSLTCYCGDRILAAQTDEQTDRLAFYKEPFVEAVGPLTDIIGKVPIHKMIFMASQEKIDALRPIAEAKLEGRASITVAIEGMLEVLPSGASKGAGLAWLLDHLGVKAENVMSMGDGENDLEMLKMTGLGVAMGNAGAKVKAVADVEVASNDNDGVADAIDEYVLKPRGLTTSAAPLVTKA